MLFHSQSIMFKDMKEIRLENGFAVRPFGWNVILFVKVPHKLLECIRFIQILPRGYQRLCSHKSSNSNHNKNGRRQPRHGVSPQKNRTTQNRVRFFLAPSALAPACQTRSCPGSSRCFWFIVLQRTNYECRGNLSATRSGCVIWCPTFNHTYIEWWSTQKRGPSVGFMSCPQLPKLRTTTNTLEAWSWPCHGG